MSASLIKQALDAAAPEMQAQVVAVKNQFLAAFGDWVNAAHKIRLEELFMAAGRAKIASLFASTLASANENQDIFDLTVDSIETIGLADWITAKAEAMKAIKASIKQILHGLAVGFGIAVKTIMGVVLPGIGALGGTIAGPGVTLLLDHLFGSSNTQVISS